MALTLFAHIRAIRYCGRAIRATSVASFYPSRKPTAITKTISHINTTVLSVIFNKKVKNSKKNIILPTTNYLDLFCSLLLHKPKKTILWQICKTIG